MKRGTAHGEEGRKLGKQGNIDHESHSDHRLQEELVINDWL